VGPHRTDVVGRPCSASGRRRWPSVAAVPDEDRARLLDAIEADLADVELALARLEAGTYETCEVCASPLGDDVLIVTPAARRCVSCADAPSV
jgi:RNA polymerase-binding transcription factor DksA